MIVKCPTCAVAVEWEATPTRPFCSERCRLLDLGKWLNEEYAIPADEPDDESETSDKGGGD